MPNVFSVLYIFIHFHHTFIKFLQRLNIFFKYLNTNSEMILIIATIQIVHKERDNHYRALWIYSYMRKEKVVRTNSKSLGLSTSIPSSG